MSVDEILADILRREGGFVNDPADPGKATNFGITQATLSAWRGHACTVQDVQTLTAAEAGAIYRQLYVAPFQDVEEAIRPQIVDVAVNAGVVEARRLLLLARMHAKDRPLGQQLAIERLTFYATIARAKPALLKFLPGWVNRALEFL